MRIDAGKLDHVLELLAAGETSTMSGEPVTDEFGQVLPDEFGQLITTYVPFATIRGQRLQMRVQDAARSGGRETYAQARFLIRYRENLATTMRVVTGAKTYNILSIEPQDRKASLIITLEEVTR